jgi:hypothetical protein
MMQHCWKATIQWWEATTHRLDVARVLESSRILLVTIIIPYCVVETFTMVIVQTRGIHQDAPGAFYELDPFRTNPFPVS